MKNLFFITAILLTIISKSQNWQYVENPGISDSISGYQCIDVDGQDTYVAFLDVSVNRRATVMKHSGNNWSIVGTKGATPDTAEFITIAINNSTPYIAFKDRSVGGKASVMKFDGANWVYVGNAGFSDGESFYTYIKFYNNEPYVVYTDRGNNDKISVSKFDGANWVYVGNKAFTAAAYRPSIDFDDSGNIYCAIRDGGTSPTFKCTVMKFDGATWDSLGNTGFSNGKAGHPNIILANNIPHVVYIDENEYKKATVMKYDGANWVTVGSPAFSTDTVNFTDIDFDGTNLFVGYTDKSLDNKIVVQTFDGSNWINVGMQGFTDGPAYTMSFGFNMSIPHVVYRDDSLMKKTSVMKFDTTANRPASASLNGNSISTNGNGKQHFWYDCDNDSLIYIGNSNIFNPSSYGNYYAIISDIGYLDTTECFEIVNGINSKSDDLYLTITPNPSNGNFAINFDNQNSEIIKSLHLYSANGKLVWSKINSFTGNSIHLDLDSGLYYLSISTNDGVNFSKKIIIN